MLGRVLLLLLVVLAVLTVQTSATALVCAGVRLGEPVQSLTSSGDAGLILTSSGRLYALNVTRSGLEVNSVTGITLPADANIVHATGSELSLGFTAVRTTVDSFIVYRGVASREGSEFVGTVHEETVRFDELSERLRSGEWRVIELAGPVSDDSGDLYAVALLESIDGDLVAEVWDLVEKRVLTELPTTGLVRLSLKGDTLLIACEDGIVTVPRNGGSPHSIPVPGEVLDSAGDWVLYRSWDGYHVAEVVNGRLARDFRLSSPVMRVAVYEPLEYVLVWSEDDIYVVDVHGEPKLAGVIDVPGRIQALSPPFIVYGDKVGVLYLAKIWLDHEAGLTHDVFIVDNEAKAIYRVCNSREVGYRTVLRRIPRKIWPPYPTEFHPDAIGVVVAYWTAPPFYSNRSYYICCSDEQTMQILLELLQHPEVQKAFDTINAKITTRAVLDPSHPAFTIDKRSNEVIFRFEDWIDFDYNDVVIGVPLLPTGDLVLKQIMYGKDWVLLELIPPDRGCVTRVTVNGRQTKFYVLVGDRTLNGPYSNYRVTGVDKLLILIKGLNEECGTIRVEFKSDRGVQFSKTIRYALPRVRIEDTSYEILSYDANDDELLTRVEARLLVRNTTVRMLSVAVSDGNGNIVTYKVYERPYPPGEYTVREEFKIRPPEQGPLKIILLAEYDGDLVIVSDREFVLRAEPERAELTVSYERPGRLTARVLDYGRDWVELRVESEEPGNLHLEDSEGRPVPYYVLEGNTLSGPYDEEHPLELGTTPVILILRDLKPGEAYRFKLVREGRIRTVFELECALPEADLDVELLSGTLKGHSLTLKFSVRGSTVNSTFKRLNLVLREDDRILWREEVDLDNTTWFDLPFETTVEVSNDEGTLTLEVTAHYDHDTVLPEGNEFEVREAPARRVLRIAYGRPHVELEDYGLNWLLLRILPWRPGDLLVRVNGKPITYYVKHGNEFEKHSGDDPYHASGANAVEVLLYGVERRGTITVINRSSTLSSASTLDYALPRGVELAAEVVGGRYLVNEGKLTLNVRTLVSPIDVTVRRIIARVLDDSGVVLGETVKTVELGPGVHELTLPIEVRVHRECGRLRLQALAEFDHGTIVRDPGEGPVPNPASRTIEFSYSAPSVRVVDRGIDWVLLEVTTREGGELVVHVNGRKAWYYLKRSRDGDWEGPYDPTSVGPNRTVLVLVPGVPPEGRISVVLGGRLERVRSVEYALPSVIARVDVEDVSVSGEKVIAMISLWLEVLGTTVRSIRVSVDGVKSWSVSALEDGEPLRLDDLELGEGVHLVRLSIKFVPKERAGTVPVTLRVQYEGDSTFDPGRREFVERPLVLTLNVPYVLPQRQASKESGPRGGSPKAPERGGTAVDRGSTTAGESGTGRSTVTEPTHAPTRVERRPSNEERPHVVRPTPPTRFPIRPVRTETGHEVKPKPLEKLPEALPHPSSSLPDTLEARLTPVLVSLFDRLWDLLTSLLSQPTITGHAEGEPTAKVTRRPIEHAPSEPSRPRTPTGSAALQGPPHGTGVSQGYHRVGDLSAHAPHTFREVEILKTRTRGYAYAEGTSRVSRSLTRLPPTGVNLLALLLSVLGVLTGLYSLYRPVWGGEGGE